jgi:hypothetical protein
VVRQTFQLARCGCTLRVTSETLYSLKYITSKHTHTKMFFHSFPPHFHFNQAFIIFLSKRLWCESFGVKISQLVNKMCSHCLFPVVDKSGTSCQLEPSCR